MKAPGSGVLLEIESEKKKAGKLKCCWITELIFIPLLVIVIGLLGMFYLHLINSSGEEVAKGPT